MSDRPTPGHDEPRTWTIYRVWFTLKNGTRAVGEWRIGDPPTSDSAWAEEVELVEVVEASAYETLRRFAFGDAPEWEKANVSQKHRIRELEAELAVERARSQGLEEALRWLVEQVNLKFPKGQSKRLPGPSLYAATERGRAALGLPDEEGRERDCTCGLTNGAGVAEDPRCPTHGYGAAPPPRGAAHQGADAVPPWVIRVCEHGKQLVYLHESRQHVHANTSPVEICNAAPETHRAVQVRAAGPRSRSEEGERYRKTALDRYLTVKPGDVDYVEPGEGDG